jgi:L-lysine exporter family protein LysE/ArgO
VIALSQVASGLLIGFALITPIGAQNIFIIQQGIAVGYPRILFATLTTTGCDALTISAGALGLGTILQSSRPLKTVLIVCGSVLLLYLAWQNLRAVPEPLPTGGQATVAYRKGTAAKAVVVSLLNPHALIDTVGVIGAVAASRGLTERAWFCAGAVLASLLWFNLLGGGAALARGRLTIRVRRMINIGSAVVMSLFAVILLISLAS